MESKNGKSMDAVTHSDSGATEPIAHHGKKALWSTPTLTRLPGEETEIQPSFGIVDIILMGS